MEQKQTDWDNVTIKAGDIVRIPAQEHRVSEYGPDWLVNFEAYSLTPGELAFLNAELVKPEPRPFVKGCVFTSPGGLTFRHDGKGVWWRRDVMDCLGDTRFLLTLFGEEHVRANTVWPEKGGGE